MTQYNEIQTMVQIIEDLERRIGTLETSGRLFASGIGAGGINVHGQGSVRIADGGQVNIYDGGNLEVYSTGSTVAAVTVGSGGKVIADGSVLFSKSSTFGNTVNITGNLRVTGNITIKNGLIKSNALQNQMTSATSQRKSTNFSITSDYRDKVSTTLTAPSWAKQGLIYVAGTVEYQNKNTSNVGMTNVRMRIENQYSQATRVFPAGAAEGYYGSSSGFSELITNPTTVDVAMQLGGADSSGASSRNTAVINMLAIWYR